jgi:vacuolar-type H+-ATPase subunit D/Vma8
MISKSKVLQSCHRFLAEKRSRLQREVLEIREAAARETKSSAGDKYETTREMMLAEAERRIGDNMKAEFEVRYFFDVESTSPAVGLRDDGQATVRLNWYF